MQLDLTRFRQPLTHVSRVFPPEAMNSGDEAYRVVGPVELELDLHKDKERFRLVGTIKATLELSCSRCAEPYQLGMDLAFDSRYVPASEMAVDEEREVGDDDLDTSEYRDDAIDLGQLMREQFYLALPMKPLCRETCKGLCPQCGINLNTGNCACSPGWDDPRLAALRALAPPPRDS